MSTNLRIIHSCTSMSFSGLEQYVLDLAVAQHRMGENVVLFCREGSDLEKAARAQDLQTWTIDQKTKKGLSSWLVIRKNWQRVLRESREKNQTVILHMHAGGEPWFHMPWLIRRKKWGLKSIQQFHLWITHAKHDPLHRFVYGLIDEVWCSSSSAQTQLQTILPFNNRYRVVRYGRDTQKLPKENKDELKAQIRAELNIPSTAKVALTAARIERVKGVEELFDAFLRVYKKLPELYVLMAGDVSPQNPGAEIYFTTLMQRYQSSDDDVKKRFLFLGYRKDFLSLLSAADTYILPTYEECMSLAMLDALCMGIPVIGTEAGGTPSVVLENQTGWLFQPRDAESLASVLLKAIPQLKKFDSTDFCKLHEQQQVFDEILKNYFDIAFSST